MRFCLLFQNVINQNSEILDLTWSTDLPVFTDEEYALFDCIDFDDIINALSVKELAESDPTPGQSELDDPFEPGATRSAFGYLTTLYQLRGLFSVYEIGDSEMVFDEMRIRHRLRDIHLRLGKNPTSTWHCDFILFGDILY
ncbi:hypothetical protein ANN_19183 [Periplaneta americana]|uniref:Uncharacterized protein n=1 Tax=Periplaneta americana TaxID=6978 RepID=A0ABQ8S9U2_PERAM|nr:hypothetical protein ANN_19183 [Periplaneta americana]